jgi:tetratricopeptide (TPR) repeat protein
VLSRASAHHRPGAYAEGVRILAEGLARHGEDATILYDLACYEALAGRRDDALAHLRRSIELEPSYRELAVSDGDFAALADDEEFSTLVP